MWSRIGTNRTEDALSKGRIVQGTHRPRDASSKGHIVQGTRCLRNTLSKGDIVQGRVLSKGYMLSEKNIHVEDALSWHRNYETTKNEEHQKHE